MPDLRELEALPDFQMGLDQLGPGTLGVSVQRMTRELAEYFGARDGVLVTSVSPDSAAAKAGLRAGDVITSLNGASVDSPSELRRRVREARSGEVTIGVVRDKKTLSLKATLETPERRTTRRRWTA
jgi:S1-C subfamily serine protease